MAKTFPKAKAAGGAQVGPKWGGGAKAPVPGTKGIGRSGYAGAKPSGKPAKQFSNRGR